MDRIINSLCKLYFTKLEAQIYLTLIQQGELSGYQLAKKIDISRSSVYAALEPMYQKGIVLCRFESAQIYTAENPVTLFERLKKEFNDNALAAEQALKELYEEKKEENFANFKGYEAVIGKTKELLNQAEKEVYLNTDFDLYLFEKEIKELRNKGVRIIVFSFAKLECDDLDVEVYTHGNDICSIKNPTRIMLVVDFKLTLVADTYLERGTWLGTVTNNALMNSIVSEHIHNDIYLLKLKEKYGDDMMDKGIKLHTMLEER